MVIRNVPITLLSHMRRQFSSSGLGHRLQPQRAAGVVDQHVDLGHPLAERPHRRGLGDVQRQGRAADLLGDPAAAVDAARPEHDVEALGGQPPGGGRADAGAGSGDDGDTAGNLLISAHVRHPPEPGPVAPVLAL
nr:hypothetical protein GCM10020241_40810 [Streptoalloteichus tenebrarius]